MFRGSVGFKKDKPIISYTQFDAYSIRDAWFQTYYNQEQVDIMMIFGQKQTITKGGTITSESYLAGGEGWDMGGNYGGDEVLVLIKTNANNDILAYVIKSRTELGEDFYTYMDAFWGSMTDAIWNTMQGWFYTTLTVSTSGGETTISDGSKSIIINTTSHAMKYGANGLWTNNTSTEYTTLSNNGRLVDGIHGPYGIPSTENTTWNDVVKSIMNKSKIVFTVTSSTEGGYKTISNGSESFLYNTTTQGFRYNSDYYLEATDANVLSTVTTYGWLTDGTYYYVGADDMGTIRDNLISTIKSDGTASASIVHDSAAGEVTISNGPYSITIADKNLGATEVYSGRAKNTTIGNHYQRGNNYGWYCADTPTTSKTKVDTTGYGPGNYYSSDTFITQNDRRTGANNNLWGGVSDTEYARQGPCPSGWHVPSNHERIELGKLYRVIAGWASIGTNLKMGSPGFRRTSDGGLEAAGNYGHYRSSDAGKGVFEGSGSDSASWDYGLSVGTGAAIRPFKNTYTLVPINNLWTGDEDTTAAIMNQHPYDYYLVGGCQSSLNIYSEGTMHNVYASYNSNTNTWSVMEVW